MPSNIANNNKIREGLFTKRHEYTAKKGIASYFFLMFVIKMYIHFYKPFFIYHLLTIPSSTSSMTSYVFSGLSKFALLEKAWIYTVMMFFPYDFVDLDLHQTQCNFRQSRSGSNSAFFHLGERFMDSLPRASNQPYSSWERADES